jgi:hypothetical protein
VKDERETHPSCTVVNLTMLWQRRVLLASQSLLQKSGVPVSGSEPTRKSKKHNALICLSHLVEQLVTRLLSIAFGAVQTRLTQGKEVGATITIADGSKVTLGIPGATEKAKSGTRYANIPLRRAAKPNEAASAVLAVASPLFSYVTGQTIEVDGGLYM